MSILSKLGTIWASMSLVAVLVAILPMGVLVYEGFLGNFSVLVNSSPSAAEIYLEGTKLGNTPLSIELKKGTYNLVAKKPGYEALEHAMYVKSRGGENIVNIQLVSSRSEPLPLKEKSNKSVANVSPELQKIAEEVKNLKSIIVLNPEAATTIPILTERVLLQAESLKAFRVELRDVREQGRWYLGSMIAIIVGLLGVIASLFISSRGK